MEATGDAARAVEIRQYLRLGIFRARHPGVRIGCPTSGCWQAHWQRGHSCWVVTRYWLGDLLDELDRRFSKPG